MKKIFYFPLEPYKERYTIQLSAPTTGWLESRWIENKIPYKRVDGISLNKEIKVGSVLDANGRGYWACSQIMEFLKLLNSGAVNSNDVLYFDDFWHPGISALPYSFHLIGIKPKMYAMLHAQSIDIFDFTYSMRHWMRPFEVGIGKILDGIFVTSNCLKDLCIYNNIGNKNNIFLCGLPYNSDEVKRHFPMSDPLSTGIFIPFFPKRKNQVIFTSRWDKEKCPDFFLKVIDVVMNKTNKVTFLITTSANKLRSNDKNLLDLLSKYLNKYPNNLFLKENLTKGDYYYNLLESKVQFNCADQDFVSWTLLEATTCGCNPVYPYFLSFPEALNYNMKYLYIKNDYHDAADKIIMNLNRQDDCSWVYKRFDSSWKRMIKVMNGEKIEDLFSNKASI